MTKVQPHIGTLREKPLHASLKQWYSRPGDRVEVAVDGYVIDLVRDNLLIEIQTRNFSSMKKKLTTLLGLGHHVRIVYPIPLDKWIVKVSGDGEIISKRRSPKHGRPLDLFAELVSFPELAVHPNLDFDLIFINEEEFRRHTPNRSWRRNGWSVEERRLIDVVDNLQIVTPDDLAALLPSDLPEPFTTADLASASGRPRRIAQQTAYSLRKAEVLAEVGKRGNAIEYRLNARDSP